MNKTKGGFQLTLQTLSLIVDSWLGALFLH